MNKIFLAPAFAVFMILAACGGNQTKYTREVSETTTQVAREVSEPITIELEGHDNMRFTGDTEVKVKPGQEITLTLKNVGKLPKETMGHNVVVLTPGTDLADFGVAAIQAKDEDYIPASFSSSIVAHTKLLGPDESDTITFQLDTPGVYDFVCSFPGHWGTMKGTITVK